MNPSLLSTQAAVLLAPQTNYSLTTLGLRPPSEGEVLVEMAFAGVCHSDENVRAGMRPFPMPAVTGHEGSGIVRAVGPKVKSIAIGDHVILNWAISCRSCTECNEGRPNLCETYSEPSDSNARFFTKEGKPVHSYCNVGCFSERIVVREECCVKIEKDFPLDVASLIGCAVATGVGAVLNTAKVKTGESVAVLGAGGVGLSTLMGAKYSGANPIIAIDRNPQKKTIAMELGATHFIDASEEDVLETVKKYTKGRGVKFAFEAAGSEKVAELAFSILASGGAAVIVGLPKMGAKAGIDIWRLVGGEKRVMGSLYGAADAAEFFPKLADLYTRGELKLDKLISRVYSLGEINEAFAQMANGAVARSLIKF